MFFFLTAFFSLLKISVLLLFFQSWGILGCSNLTALPELEHLTYSNPEVSPEHRHCTYHPLQCRRHGLKKLLDNYNPNGVQFLVLLTYVDDEKDKFDQIRNSIKNHIQGHDEGSFAYQLNSFKHYQTESWTGNHYIQTAKCKYILGEYAPTVYHVFVRMGR